jgi:ankyrin repeat protein
MRVIKPLFYFIFVFLNISRADVNVTDNFKWTPLHHAAHSGVLDVVQAIVDAGGAINAESITKATPLMRAIESSSFPVCEYLVNKGAKVAHENISGLEPLTVAAEFADPRIYHLINEKVGGASGNKPKSGARKKTGSAGSKKRPQTGGKSAKTEPVMKHIINIIYKNCFFFY